jgi:hypothetical protein
MTHHRLEQSEEPQTEYRADPSSISTTSSIVTPEMEDARRRFLLALRAMILRREKEEQNRAAIEKWTETLKREIAAYRKLKRRNRIRWVLRTGFIVLILWSIINGKGGSYWFFWFFMPAALADVASSTRKETATALARARDPRAVSVLAIGCRDGDDETRAVCARGLKSILPGLQASDAQYVTDEGMDALIALLKMADDDLLLAALKGLEQVGDSRAIPAVEALLEDSLEGGLVSSARQRWRHRARMRFVWKQYLSGNPPGPIREQEIQAAARSCLTYLRQRDEQERARQTLLRPAQSPENPAEVLLRPAAGAPSAPTEQLLRPVE